MVIEGRRRLDRVPRFRRWVRVTCDAPAFTGMTYDLSVSGLSGATDAVLEEGALVSLALTLADRSVARVQGRIVWVVRGPAPGGSTRFGLKLSQADERYRQLVGAEAARLGRPAATG